MKAKFLALAGGIALLSTLVTSQAGAAGNCTASRRAWAGGTWEGVHLQRTKNCMYYAKFAMDHPSYGIGLRYEFKVERQVRSPYGWFISETKSKSTYWAQGERNTASVNGWPP